MPELTGVVVLLTRSPEDNLPLARALRSRGAEVLELRCVRVEPVRDASPVAAAVRALGPEDWLVLTSRVGAEVVLGAVPASAIRARVAAVGESTARRLAEAGLAAFTPSRADGETLGRELPLEPSCRVLLARADRAARELSELLRARGARVEEAVAYRTVAGASGDVAAVRRRLRASEIDIVVFASPSAADGLCHAVAAEELRGPRFVVIGRTTAARVRECLGVEPRIADDPSVDGLARAIERAAVEAGYVAHV